LDLLFACFALSCPGLGLFLPELSLRFVHKNRIFAGLACLSVYFNIDLTELTLLATELAAFFPKVTHLFNHNSIINRMTFSHALILLIPFNSFAKFENVLEHFVVLEFQIFQ
jgi:hypothetical protein